MGQDNSSRVEPKYVELLCIHRGICPDCNKGAEVTQCSYSCGHDVCAHCLLAHYAMHELSEDKAGVLEYFIANDVRWAKREIRRKAKQAQAGLDKPRPSIKLISSGKRGKHEAKQKIQI